MKGLDVLAEKLSRIMDRIAGLGIFLIMLLVVGNIILRTVFKQPLVGAVDYVNVLIAVSIGLAIGYCAFQDGHIAVEFIVARMPEKLSAAVAIVVDLLALAFWGLASWYAVGFACSMASNGLVTSTSQIPLSPVVYTIALGLLVICLVLLLNLIKSIRKVME